MCCGSQRQQFRPARSDAHAVRAAGDRASEATRRQPAVYFEHVGSRGLTVVGGASGARYRFEARGVVVAADPRDRLSLQGVPSLRQVPSPW